MKRIFLTLSTLLILTLLLGCLSNSSAPINLKTAKVNIGNTTITAWIADTAQTREKGLMGVSNLNEKDGMLFVFDKPGEYSFWMKDTIIPLDILFVSNNMTIVSVQNMVPCTIDPCKIYSPNSAVEYAIEVGSGFADKYNITSGERIEIE